MKLASRMDQIEGSATLAVTNKAAALQAQGIDVVGFGAGQPDFDTPQHIIDAAKRGLDEGWTRYTPTGGLPVLIDAIVKHVDEHFGMSISANEVMTSCGGKHSLYNVTQALIEPGDEVLLPAPFWVTYPTQITMAGGTTRVVSADSENGFRVRAEDLEAAIGPKTRGLILNSPSNPTGAGYRKADLEAIAEVVAKHDLWVISDEMYAKLTYGGYESTWFATLPGMRERTVTVYGLSKTYAMTGWRVGITIADKSLISACNRMQGQVTTNIASMVQAGAVAALSDSHAFLDTWLEKFDDRRRYMVERLNGMDGVSCNFPDGAFYAFPDLRGLLGRKAGDREMTSDWDLIDYLLEDANVALVPGTPFGAPGFARLSYATSMETIEKGMDRMEAAFSRLS